MSGKKKGSIQDDSIPHKAAVAAMWIWHQEYAQCGLGITEFWGALSKSRKMTACNAVKQIEKAPST